MSLYFALQADAIRYLLGWLAFSSLSACVITFAAFLNENCSRQSGRLWLAACCLWLALFAGLLTVQTLIPTTAHALRLIGAE